MRLTLPGFARFCCILLFSLAGALPALATITVGTTVGHYPGGSGSSVSVTVNVSSGGAMVVMCTTASVQGTAPTDSAGNTGHFTLAQTYVDGFMGRWDEWYITNAAGSSSDSMTCNWGSSVSGPGITVVPLTGIVTSNALDVIDAVAGTSTAMLSNPFSLSQPSEIIIALGGSFASGTYTPSSGYTSIAGPTILNGGAASYQIFSSLQYLQTAGFTSPASPSHTLIMTIGLKGSSNQTIPTDSATGGPALVQWGMGVVAGAGNNWQAVFGKNVTSGNIVIITGQWHTTTTPPTPTDSLSTTYTLVKSYAPSTTQAMWCGTLGSSGANTVQVGTSNFANQNISVAEYSGASCTVDAAAQASASSITLVPTATLNNTYSGDLIIADALVVAAGSTYVYNNPPGIPIQVNTESGAGTYDGVDQYVVAPSSGYVALQFNNPANQLVTTIVAAFKASSFKVTTAALADCALTNAYSFQLQQVGANGGVTWSKTGSLPPGISLNSSTGVVSGTPTGGGTYTLTFTATDSLSNTATSSSLTIRVGSSFGTTAIVQTHTSTLCGSGETLSIGTVTSGNLILIAGTRAISTEGGNAFWALGSITDTLSTTYTAVPQQTELPALGADRPGQGYYFWGIATSSGADTITCNQLARNSAAIVVTELSNAQKILDFGAVGWSYGFISGTTTYSSGSITLPVGAAVFGHNQSTNQAATLAFQSPFTSQSNVENGDNTSNIWTGYDLSVAAGAASASVTQTVTGSDAWENLLLAIRPAIGSVAPASTSGMHGAMIF